MLVITMFDSMAWFVVLAEDERASIEGRIGWAMSGWCLVEVFSICGSERSLVVSSIVICDTIGHS